MAMMVHDNELDWSGFEEEFQRFVEFATDELNEHRDYPAFSKSESRGNLPKVKLSLKVLLRRLASEAMSSVAATASFKEEAKKPSVAWLLYLTDFERNFKDHVLYLESKPTISSQLYIAQQMDNLRRPLEWAAGQCWWAPHGGFFCMTLEETESLMTMYMNLCRNARHEATKAHKGRTEHRKRGIDTSTCRLSQLKRGDVVVARDDAADDGDLSTFQSKASELCRATLNTVQSHVANHEGVAVPPAVVVSAFEAISLQLAVRGGRALEEYDLRLFNSRESLVQMHEDDQLQDGTVGLWKEDGCYQIQAAVETIALTGPAVALLDFLCV